MNPGCAALDVDLLSRLETPLVETEVEDKRLLKHDLRTYTRRILDVEVRRRNQIVVELVERRQVARDAVVKN